MFCISCTLLSDAIYRYIYECALHDQIRIDHAQSSHMQRHDASGTDSLRTNYPIHTLDFEFHTTVRLFCSTQGHQLWHHQPTPTQPAHRAPSWNVNMNVTDNTWHITASVLLQWDTHVNIFICFYSILFDLIWFDLIFFYYMLPFYLSVRAYSIHRLENSEILNIINYFWQKLHKETKPHTRPY